MTTEDETIRNWLKLSETNAGTATAYVADDGGWWRKAADVAGKATVLETKVAEQSAKDKVWGDPHPWKKA